MLSETDKNFLDVFKAILDEMSPEGEKLNEN
jgi:hypothetical protein